jgi:hypothetical protein
MIGVGGWVVFGVAKRGTAPQAGLFTVKDKRRAARIAGQAGLMTLELSGDDLNQLTDQLDRGSIVNDGQLRLHSISPRLLHKLRAMHLSQAGQHAAPAPSDEISPADPGLPPDASEPPGGAVDLGPDLIAACLLLDKAGEWIEQLRAELGEILARVGKVSKFGFLKPVEPDDVAYRGGDSWVYNGWRWSFPVRHDRRRIGQLSVIADIGKVGRPAIAINMPCVVVAWSGIAHNWVSAVDTAAGFWPPPTATVSLAADRLFQWTGETAANGPDEALSLLEGAWFYLVPMQALQTTLKLRMLVVHPALELLAGSSIDAAFAAAPDILRFKQSDDGPLIETS